MTHPARFLFTAWEGGGNVTPAIVAAKKLVDRGHAVRFMSEECNRGEAEAVGAEFVAWRRAPNRSDRTRHSQTYKDWEEQRPGDGLVAIIQDMWCGPSLAYAEDVVEELQRRSVDLVVTNDALFGVMAGCESIGQPFVILSPNVSLKPLPGVPPLGPGLPPARTPEERAMHAAMAQGAVALFDSGLPALNATRAALGLPALAHLFDQYDAAVLELFATSPAFDFPADYLPERARYVGPQLGDPAWAQPWVLPWPAEDTRPLVAVGFSTTFQNHTAVLQKVIDALAPLSARVLVTRGGSIEDGELRAAENTVIVESAPHSALMREAAAAVTHGGHGTVIRALASQVPMLVIPHGRDQNDNAVRVTERGAGLRLMATASMEEIRAACARLLGEESFRHAARQLGQRIAHDAEHSTLVQEIEACVARHCRAAA